MLRSSLRGQSTRFDALINLSFQRDLQPCFLLLRLLVLSSERHYGHDPHGQGWSRHKDRRGQLVANRLLHLLIKKLHNGKEFKSQKQLFGT